MRRCAQAGQQPIHPQRDTRRSAHIVTALSARATQKKPGAACRLAEGADHAASRFGASKTSCPF
jgi:hypothetical protein